MGMKSFLLSLPHRVTTQTLLQIIVVLAATVAMKAYAVFM
jgi:hypothetical protein